MPPNSDRVRLRHMLDAAERALRHARSRARADLDRDELFAHGVVHMLLVLGEAAARVSEPGRSGLPTIPWRQIVGMRNHLIHGYDDIEFDVVWKLLNDDLPPLIRELERALAGGDT